jgi:DNA-binding transcriptional ArsR family regulator
MRTIRILLLTSVAAAFGAASLQIRALDGRIIDLFRPAGVANVLFFISSDCPISNSYAPEIQRICREYEKKGIACSLLYEDLDLSQSAARKHLDEYRYRLATAAIDSDRKAANRSQATVTPEAVVVDSRGEIRYRGRIDNFYAALGKPRQVVTVHDLTEALDAVIAGKPVANPETKALGCYIVQPDILKK